ncbi:uncharacterized protein LOC144343200 [Saccoglossus kowalevskii]
MFSDDQELCRDLVLKAVKEHLGHISNTSQLKPTPTGKFNQSYYVGNSHVVRIAPPDDSVFVFYEKDMMKQEPCLHELLLDKTTLPVAKILVYDNSRRYFNRDFVLMQRLPGEPLTNARSVDLNKILFQVGAYLAEVHDITAEKYGYLGEHCPMEPQSSWVEAFEIMWTKLIDGVQSLGYYNDAERKMLTDLFLEHRSKFDRPIKSSLLHMDLWHENILVNADSNVTGILDWDRAMWGDPEIEFAVLDYVSMSEPAFWEGYGRKRDESPDAKIRRIFYLLYELQKYIIIRAGRNGRKILANQFKEQTMQIVYQHFRKRVICD